MNAYRRTLRFGRGSASLVLALATTIAGCSSDGGSQGTSTAASTSVAASASAPATAEPLWAAPGTSALSMADDLQAALDDWVSNGTLDGVTAGLEHTWLQPEEVANAALTVGGQTSHTDIVDPDGPNMPSAAFNSAWLGAGSTAADAADAALWAYLLFGGRIIDTALVEQMQADPQPEPNIGDYALGVNMLDLGTVTLVGHAGGGIDLPYTAAVYVVLGDVPVAIAVLTPQAADHATQIFDLFMHLHELTVG